MQRLARPTSPKCKILHFDDDEMRRSRLAHFVLDRLRRMDDLARRSRLAEAALAAALEAISAPALLVDGDGNVAHANAAAVMLLECGLRPHPAICASDPDGGWCCSRVAARDVPPHFLMVQRRIERTAEARIALANERWRLSRRQAEVLRGLVAGDGNKAIATRLGCTVGTVESHVTALLKKAGCDGRGLVVARVWGLS